MSNRIEKTFEKLRSEKRSAFIPFIMGYDPDARTCAELLAALPGAGADMIEVGIPFSDPMADGPVIQASGRRALAAGASVANIISLVREFRKKDNHTPVILMGYFNPVYRYGAEKFCNDATQAGVDGVILVDLPPEEDGEIRHYLTSTGLKLISLIAPTSDEERLPSLCASASGFIYYISVAGITGAKVADGEALKAQVKNLREYTELPIAVGFGIKTAGQVSDISEFSDAVVVGSALVNKLANADSGKEVATAIDFVKSLTGR